MNCEEEEVPKVLEDFWANMDPKGFSFWRLEYEPCKGECEVLLKTENLIDMFTQKCGPFLKYMFGVMGVYGQEPTLKVRGVWMWRGFEETPLELSGHPSYEFYKKVKLDPFTKPEDKALVMEYWTQTAYDQSLVEGELLRDIKILR